MGTGRACEAGLHLISILLRLLTTTSHAGHWYTAVGNPQNTAQEGARTQTVVRVSVEGLGFRGSTCCACLRALTWRSTAHAPRRCAGSWSRYAHARSSPLAASRPSGAHST